MKNLQKGFVALLIIISITLSSVPASCATEVGITPVADGSELVQKIAEGNTTLNKSSYSGDFTISTEKYITLKVYSLTNINVTILGLSGEAEDIGVSKKFDNNPQGDFTTRNIFEIKASWNNLKMNRVPRVL